GGKVRTAKLLEHLRPDFDVTLVSNVEPLVDDPHLGEARRLCAELIAVPWVEAPKDGLRYFASVLRHLASPYPISVARDYSAPFAGRVQSLDMTGGFDLLVCDFVQPSINLNGVRACPRL